MHWDRRAASLADWTAGRSRAIRTAMIAITTSNSINVNPRRDRIPGWMTFIESLLKGRGSRSMRNTWPRFAGRGVKMEQEGGPAWAGTPGGSRRPTSISPWVNQNDPHDSDVVTWPGGRPPD